MINNCCDALSMTPRAYKLQFGPMVKIYILFDFDCQFFTSITFIEWKTSDSGIVFRYSYAISHRPLYGEAFLHGNAT